MNLGLGKIHFHFSSVVKGRYKGLGRPMFLNFQVNVISLNLDANLNWTIQFLLSHYKTDHKSQLI